MHVKSTLIAAAILISSTAVMPVQAQDFRADREGELAGLRQRCDEGDHHACVRFGMLLNENRHHHDEWRRSHPEFWWFEGDRDRGDRDRDRGDRDRRDREDRE
jgi:hypothetical protein